MSITYLLLGVWLLDACRCDFRDALSVGEDGRMNFESLSRKYAQAPVTHYVTTDDGYILHLFNIPGDKTRPVMMVHGIFDSSTGFVLRGNLSLGVLVAEEGYDTWFPNFRGNMYSRNHTTLNPDTDEQFWDFGPPEYAKDVATCIDYILNVTGQKQVSVIGFSEGTTSMFILGSKYTEYNEKVKIFIGLAPVAFMDHVRPALSYIVNVSPVIDFLLPRSMQEIGGYYSLSKAFINMLCTQLAFGYELCYQGGINSISGMNSVGIEKDFFPTIIANFPCGTSRKNLLHFAQISLRKNFAAYDYGANKNWKVYKSVYPPVYDLSQMTMKTVLFSGPNDIVSTLEDVGRLKKYVPNIIEHKVVQKECFNHLDFMWGRDAYELVYKDVLDSLRQYSL